MAQSPASRAVKKARRAKKKGVSASKPGPVAAKPVKSPPSGKARVTNKKSLSIKGGRSKPEAAAAPRASLAKPKAKIPRSRGAPVAVTAAKARAASPRPGGKTHAPQRAGSVATQAGPKAKVPGARGKTKRAPPYLAAELGQPVDHEGEPVGAGSALARTDADLQAYSLRLWRQMQSGRAVSGYLRAVERAGLTIDEVWTVGITDVGSTSSSPDELRRYHQKLLFRANLLEAILSETVADLHRLPGIEPTPSDKASEPA